MRSYIFLERLKSQLEKDRNSHLNILSIYPYNRDHKDSAEALDSILRFIKKSVNRKSTSREIAQEIISFCNTKASDSATPKGQRKVYVMVSGKVQSKINTL